MKVVMLPPVWIILPLLLVFVLQTPQSMTNGQPDEEMDDNGSEFPTVAPILDITRPLHPPTSISTQPPGSDEIFVTNPLISRPVPTLQPTLYIPPSLLTEAPSSAPTTRDIVLLTKPPRISPSSNTPPSILNNDPFVISPSSYKRPSSSSVYDSSSGSPSSNIIYEFGEVTMEPSRPIIMESEIIRSYGPTTTTTTSAMTVMTLTPTAYDELMAETTGAPAATDEASGGESTEGPTTTTTTTTSLSQAAVMATTDSPTTSSSSSSSTTSMSTSSSQWTDSDDSITQLPTDASPSETTTETTIASHDDVVMTTTTTTTTSNDEEFLAPDLSTSRAGHTTSSRVGRSGRSKQQTISPATLRGMH